MNKNALIDKLIELIRPIVEELNYELYHLEYVTEG
ncbi:MAG: ribosome maturation factor RimP, partial [Clostridiaceae bacterium]|nr:ribosome maturation factor RimP [Clostridiaceae bacterium]